MEREQVIQTLKLVGGAVLVIAAIAMGLGLLVLFAGGAAAIGAAIIAGAIALGIAVSFALVIPFVLLGVVSHKKSLVTSRRRNLIVGTTLFLFLGDIFQVSEKVTLLEFILGGNEQVFWGFASISVGLISLTYVLYLYEDGLRFALSKDEAATYAVKVLPSSIVFTLRDLVLPVALVVAFLNRYGADALGMLDLTYTLVFWELDCVRADMGITQSLDHILVDVTWWLDENVWPALRDANHWLERQLGVDLFATSKNEQVPYSPSSRDEQRLDLGTYDVKASCG